MPRPKKVKLDNLTPVQEQSVPQEVPVAEPVATAVATSTEPKPLKLDYSVAPHEVQVKWHPEVRGGICEFCGVLDNTVPAWEQWKLCNHYKGVELRCLYCPRGTEPDEWFKGRTLKIVERLDRPGILSVFCSDIRCVQKFYAGVRA